MSFLNFVLVIVGYSTARIMVPILTIGWVQVQPSSSDETGFNWLGFKRTPENSLLLHTSAAGCLGLVPWLILIVYYLWRAKAG